jgi:hypothetical protein
MTLGTWGRMSGTSPHFGLTSTSNGSPNNVNPDPTDSAAYSGASGFDSIWRTWNSGVYVPTLGTYGSILYFGGGHGDYWGNGIVRYDLATRQYSMLTLPSTAGPLYSGAFLTNGLYNDGTPSPPHTYAYLIYAAQANAMVCLKSIEAVGAPFSGASAGVARPHIFDCSTLTWRLGATASGFECSSGGAACYDSLRDVAWCMEHDSGRWARFQGFSTDNGNGTYGSWTVYGQDSMDRYGQLRHDPVNDWLLYFELTGNALRRKDPNNPSTAYTTVTRSGTWPTLTTSGSVHWSSVLGGFVYHQNASGNVYLIQSANNWSSATATLLTVSTNGLAFNRSSSGDGQFGRSQTIEYGSRVVQMLAPDFNVPMLGMRLA